MKVAALILAAASLVGCDSSLRAASVTLTSFREHCKPETFQTRQDDLEGVRALLITCESNRVSSTAKD